MLDGDGIKIFIEDWHDDLMQLVSNFDKIIVGSCTGPLWEVMVSGKTINRLKKVEDFCKS